MVKQFVILAAGRASMRMSSQALLSPRSQKMYQPGDRRARVQSPSVAPLSSPPRAAAARCPECVARRWRCDRRLPPHGPDSRL